MFCSFLALILRKELRERLQRKGHALEWADVVSDLDALQEFDVQCQHKHFVLRSEVKGTCEGNAGDGCGGSCHGATTRTGAVGVSHARCVVLASCATPCPGLRTY